MPASRYPYNNHMPPRRGNGRFHRRDTFGDAKQGDSTLARFDPDRYPPVDWRDAGDDYANVMNGPSHEDRVRGCTPIKPRE